MQGDPFHNFKGVSFAGIPCAQYWCDFLLWEAVLNTNPQLRGIVELGTWQGGFSLYLAAQARARGLSFATFDATPPDREIIGFIRLDIYRSPEGVGHVLSEFGPVALFCDGGNKPRELGMFPPMCAEGSIFLVHDWGTETPPESVPDFLEELYGDYCDEIGSVTRVFKMRENA